MNNVIQFKTKIEKDYDAIRENLIDAIMGANLPEEREMIIIVDRYYQFHMISILKTKDDSYKGKEINQLGMKMTFFKEIDGYKFFREIVDLSSVAN